MKKRIIIPIGIILILGITTIICISITRNRNNEIEEPIIRDKKFLNAGNIIDEEYEAKNKVFTNYEKYKEVFNSDEITEKDFEENNYVLIDIEYDPCRDKNLIPISHTINENNIDVVISYEAGCGVCPQDHEYYLLKVDKTITEAKVNIEYKVSKKEYCDPNVTYKPLIYIYPEEETEVTIKLGKPELLTTTYPKYNNEWKVIAKPNGDLIDENGITYYGLYWEGLNNIKTNFKDGFVVEKEKLIPFLEEKLKVLGLNERERNEFIIYWLPLLEKNQYNLIRFESLEIINQEMPLDINPKPKSIIRVLMEYKPINRKITIQEQKLNTPKREGYTIVEWGGTIIK
ncbi:MAG: hypothetical protein IJG68_04535 [Bacilli bacterium]|nr:hypothetical protein [Bacilli bacterium]